MIKRILIGLSIFFVFGLLFSISQELYYDRYTADEVKQSEVAENELNAINSYLSDNQQLYLDCVRTRDDSYLINNVDDLYSEQGITFEEYPPNVLQNAILKITRKKCADFVPEYENKLSKQIDLKNKEIEQNDDKLVSKLSYTSERFNLKFTVARDKGKLLYTNSEIINFLKR